MFLKSLCLIAVMNLHTAMGKATNDPICPKTRPVIGSVCSIPKEVGCQYKPYTCPESETAYLSRCVCTNGVYVCAESKPPTCNCPSTRPESLQIFPRCTLGTKCRYDPVGCRARIKFATNCECISRNGKNTYLCTTAKINCKAPNDPACPAKPDFGGACDPTKVNRCKYNPYGCPGTTIGELFIYNCQCEPSEKIFVCDASAVQDCNEASLNSGKTRNLI